ncbi:hypothetical protein BDA96_06G189300 [Sorghum bicolor]|uniref:Uncharacterized protein n=1 Tax=Sorghum bicolor TaxID=4558 RepID=A0A921QSF0_SORBI|nr:hypothetical protein BDA96_06G189300 [Sorghum bicolor]KAG0526939.1 hypothetical protein BDA96_06G189300 [Sorghum bicolor]
MPFDRVPANCERQTAPLLPASPATSIYQHTPAILISARPTSRRACHGLSEIALRFGYEAANPTSLLDRLLPRYIAAPM